LTNAWGPSPRPRSCPGRRCCCIGRGVSEQLTYGEFRTLDLSPFADVTLTGTIDDTPINLDLLPNGGAGQRGVSAALIPKSTPRNRIHAYNLMWSRRYEGVPRCAVPQREVLTTPRERRTRQSWNAPTSKRTGSCRSTGSAAGCHVPGCRYDAFAGSGCPCDARLMRIWTSPLSPMPKKPSAVVPTSRALKETVALPP
jgi:hypothetical protein